MVMKSEEETVGGKEKYGEKLTAVTGHKVLPGNLYSKNFSSFEFL